MHPGWVFGPTLLLFASLSRCASADGEMNVLFVGDSNDRNMLVYVCEKYRGVGSSYGGDDFVTSTGPHVDHHWDSGTLGHFEIGGQMLSKWDLKSFRKVDEINFSSIRCLLPTFSVNFIYLQIFGSSDGPYHLNLCNKRERFNGPYCKTSDRLPRGIATVGHYFGRIDMVVFNTCGWDLATHRNSLHPEMAYMMRNVARTMGVISKLLPRAFLILRTSATNPAAPKPGVFEYNSVVTRRVYEDLRRKRGRTCLFDLERDLSVDDKVLTADQYHLTSEGLGVAFKLLLKALVSCKRENNSTAAASSSSSSSSVGSSLNLTPRIGQGQGQGELSDSGLVSLEEARTEAYNASYNTSASASARGEENTDFFSLPS